jgi:hypothetical protein
MLPLHHVDGYIYHLAGEKERQWPRNRHKSFLECPEAFTLPISKECDRRKGYHTLLVI